MVPQAAGGSAISANTAVGGSATAWTTLTGPVFSESAAGMLTGGNPTGGFGFSPPTGFEFQAGGVGVAVTTNGPGTCASTAPGNMQTAALILIAGTRASTTGDLFPVTAAGPPPPPPTPSPLKAGTIVAAFVSPRV